MNSFLRKITCVLSLAGAIWSLNISSVNAAPSYFGYFCSSCEQVGGGGYTPLTRDHANVAFIAAASPYDAVTRIQEAAAYGMKSAIAVNHIFFDQNYQLYSNYQQRWNDYANVIGPYIGNVVAIYPQDEPNLYGFDRSRLYAAIQSIKSKFPGIPVATIYAPLSSYVGIDLFDWAGIYCYSNGQFSCSGISYLTKYNQFKSLLATWQRTILVPQAGVPSGIVLDNALISALSQEIYQYKSISDSDPKVVAVFPFLYQNMSGWHGLENLPTLRCQFVGYANSFVYRPPSNLNRVYRFSHPSWADHFYSLNLCEGTNAGYRYEGIHFHTSVTPLSGGVQLKRCRVGSTGKHFTSSSPTCEGQVTEGSLGYIYVNQVSNAMPVYRYYNPGADDHLTTIWWGEGANGGYVLENIQGYSPIPQTP